MISAFVDPWKVSSTRPSISSTLYEFVADVHGTQAALRKNGPTAHSSSNAAAMMPQPVQTN
jgi:hypothetical protein